MGNEHEVCFRAGVLLCASAVGPWANAQEAVRIDPENAKYLLFKGKPLALISASEHYGSVINRPFDFEKYLDDAAAHKMTMTRTFLLYRELQSARNPSSPCKPESPDFIAPWVRTGPEKALDGEPIYDLDRWNPEYFDRLHRFLDGASKRGIVVELTVFSNTYAENIWALNPLRKENNLQHVGDVEWEDYNSLKNRELVERQKAYARKIIAETSGYDNVYYEICNEPGGGVAGHASPAEVDAWQDEMGRVMREELQRSGRPHLLAGQRAFTYSGGKATLPMDASFAGNLFDIVNDHPLPDTTLKGRVYDMGNFMSEELRLAEVADFCKAAWTMRQPTALDEDNAASMYRDTAGWTIHRKRAWTTTSTSRLRWGTSGGRRGRGPGSGGGWSICRCSWRRWTLCTPRRIRAGCGRGRRTWWCRGCRWAGGSLWGTSRMGGSCRMRERERRSRGA